MKNLLVSLALVFLISCAETPRPYTRNDLANTLSKICKDEFNLSVNVWDEGETLWLYSPFDNLIDSSGNYNENIKSNLRRIMRTIGRVILNTDKKPQFYCLVASDIKKGADLYFVGHTQDHFLSRFKRHSSDELVKREVFMWVSNPNAIGDTKGTHVARHDITIGEFISYLIRQNIEKEFTAEGIKNFFQINNIQAEYGKGRLKISIDIKVKEYKAKLPDPFEEAKKIVTRYMEIYNPQDIVEIEINDTIKDRFYSKKALLEEK